MSIADTIRIQDADPDEMRGLFAPGRLVRRRANRRRTPAPRRPAGGDDVAPSPSSRGSSVPTPWLLDGRGTRGPLAGALLEMVERRRVARAAAGLAGARAEGFAQLRGDGPVDPQFPWGDQTNTSVTFGDRLVLEAVPAIEGGINPELEIGRFLTDRTTFIHAAPMAGAIELSDHGGAASTVAILQGFVQNEGDAWQYALDAVRESFERASLPSTSVPRDGRDGHGRRAPPAHVRPDRAFLGSAWLLGRGPRSSTSRSGRARTTRCSRRSPSPGCTSSLYQSMRSQAVATLRRLGREEVGPEVESCSHGRTSSCRGSPRHR